MDATTAKDILTGLGADLCGIAPADGFEEAPEGFHPSDVFPTCRSVAVFARRLPVGPGLARSRVPYSHANDLSQIEVDALALKASLELEALGARSVLIPSDEPYEYWDPGLSRGMGIISLRHAARLAGLGVLGKNTLLLSEEYGNMITIGAVLLDVDLEGDPLARYRPCPEDCNLCVESCRRGALDGETVDQHACRELSIRKSAKGAVLYGCNECRIVCPNYLGIAGPPAGGS